jgi:hypothetical protein
MCRPHLQYLEFFLLHYSFPLGIAISFSKFQDGRLYRKSMMAATDIIKDGCHHESKMATTGSEMATKKNSPKLFNDILQAISCSKFKDGHHRKYKMAATMNPRWPPPDLRWPPSDSAC